MNIINFIESIFSTEDTEYTEWKSVIIRALRGRFQLLTEDILVAAYCRLLLAIAVLTPDRVRDGGTAIAGVRGVSRFGRFFRRAIALALGG